MCVCEGAGEGGGGRGGHKMALPSQPPRPSSPPLRRPRGGARRRRLSLPRGVSCRVVTGRAGLGFRGGGLWPGLAEPPRGAPGCAPPSPSRWHRGPGAGGEPLRAALRRRAAAAQPAGGKAAAAAVALPGIAPAGLPPPHPAFPQSLGREVRGRAGGWGGKNGANLSRIPLFAAVSQPPRVLLIKETDLGPATATAGWPPGRPAPSCPHHGVHPEEEKQEIPKL